MYFNQLLLRFLLDLWLRRFLIGFMMSLLQFFCLFFIGLNLRNNYLCLFCAFLDDIFITLYGNNGVLLEETAVIWKILKGFQLCLENVLHF